MTFLKIYGKKHAIIELKGCDKALTSITSLSSQLAEWNNGTAESIGVNSSVYVFTRIRLLYLIESKL